MYLIGLTGSIGMGKSQTALLFEEVSAEMRKERNGDMKLARYDADAAVHQLYARGGAAVAAIGALFPQAVSDGAIDRTLLGQLVLGQPDALKALEAIVHPLARQAQMDFLEREAAKGTQYVVLDIPLLFETASEKWVDCVVVVSAPEHIQAARVLARDNMTREKLDHIRAQQMPDGEKRARADFIVDSSVSVDDARQQIRAILQSIHDSPKAQSAGDGAFARLLARGR